MAGLGECCGRGAAWGEWETRDTGGQAETRETGGQWEMREAGGGGQEDRFQDPEDNFASEFIL